jgi:hypothetical protein
MKTKELVEKAGKVEVNLAPLLLLIGAVMSSENLAPQFEDVFEILFRDPDDEDSE